MTAEALSYLQFLNMRSRKPKHVIKKERKNNKARTDGTGRD